MSPAPDDTGACDAPFDRIEELARTLCRDSGRNWDQPRTRKAHWRTLAAAQLAGPVTLADEPPLFQIACACLLVGAGAGALLLTWLGAP